MSFKKKYYYTFKDLNNIQFTVEIWQDTTANITAEEIRGDSNPLVLQYPKADKFSPVRGSGCELNLLSTTDRKFFDLYTADMLEYQIRVYKNNVLFWLGYLDSELYTEAFNSISNYGVTFSGTDGLALLERLNYLDANGNAYQGIVTQFQVVKNILEKLNLAFEGIYISLSTTSTQLPTASGETILHKTYCNNQNWYNEDGDAETCRSVLEHILRPYAAFLIQDNARLIITDINTLASLNTANFLKYDNSFNYVSTVNIDLDLGDLTAIGFAESNQQLNVVSGYNKQVIKYSPYINADLVNYTNTDFTNISGSTIYGNIPYRWKETIYNNSNTWVASNNGRFASYTGYETSNLSEGDSYLKINRYSINNDEPQTLSFKLTKKLPYIIPSDLKLKISLSAYFRTTTDLNGITTTADIYQGKLRTRLKIGDRYYYRHSTVNYPSFSTSQGWTNTADSFDLDFESRSITTYEKNKVIGYNAIDNNWIDLKKYSGNGGFGDTLAIVESDYLISLKSGYYSGIQGGTLEFEIYDFDIMVNPVGNTPNYTAIKNSVIDVRLKDIKLSIVDESGNEINDSDVEYIAYMNSKLKNEAPIITTYQGTSKIKNSVEKGALLGLNENGYYFLTGYTRADKTDCIENLLLRSIESNYENKTIQLLADINNISSVVGTLTYQNFLTNKKFMIVENNYYLADSKQSVVIEEIIEDNLEINKSF